MTYFPESRKKSLLQIARNIKVPSSSELWRILHNTPACSPAINLTFFPCSLQASIRAFHLAQKDAEYNKLVEKTNGHIFHSSKETRRGL